MYYFVGLYWHKLCYMLHRNMLVSVTKITGWTKHMPNLYLLYLYISIMVMNYLHTFRCAEILCTNHHSMDEI